MNPGHLTAPPCYFTLNYMEACAQQAAIMTLKEQNKLHSEHQMRHQWACGCQVLPCSPLNIFYFTFPSVFLVWFIFSSIQNQTSSCHRKQRKGITRNQSQKCQTRSFVEGQSGSQKWALEIILNFFICRSHLNAARGWRAKVTMFCRC